MAQQPVIILADGEFPRHPAPLGLLDAADTIVCCDSAAEKLWRYGKEPACIAGDLDSLSDALKARFADRLHLVESQETNDLTKAVDYCLQQGFTQLYILGATGLREDHTLANISLLADYAERCQIELLTNHGVFTPLLHTATLKSHVGQQVSIFSLTPDTPVTLHGLKYPLHEFSLRSWWMGSLNEATGNEFTVAFPAGKLIVFRTF